MENMEIERKFLIKELPADLAEYPHRTIEQGYLCKAPVVRVRKSGDKYSLTYKGEGLVAREEHNLPLTAESYDHLIKKADGNIIKKERYVIPLLPDDSHFISLTDEDRALMSNGLRLKVELDVFEVPSGLVMAEIEFPTLSMADNFIMLPWFSKDVSSDPAYHNVNMAYR